MLTDEQDERLKAIENALIGAGDRPSAKPQAGGAIDVLRNIENALVGNGKKFTAQEGGLVSVVRKIASRINFANRPDGTPYLVAVQGDVDLILAAVAGVKTGTVDVADLASRLRDSLGDEIAKEVADELARRIAS